MTRSSRTSPGRRRLAVATVALLIVVLVAALAANLASSSGSSTPKRERRSSTQPQASAALANIESPLAGKPLPPVAMKRFDDNGSEVRLRDLAGGKPMLVNIWSTTCEPCKRETPALESVYRQAKGKVAFVGVNVSDTADTGRAFFHKYGVTYDQVRDPRAQLATAVGSPVLPTTLFVDTDGRIVDAHIGALTASKVRSLLAGDLAVRLG